MTEAADDPARAATRWLVLLADDPEDATTRRGFEAWYAADPRHAAAWARSQRADALIRATRPATADLPPMPPPAKVPARRFRRVPLFCLAMLMGMIGLLYGPELALRLQADHVTGNGEQREVALADGSRVHLDAGSAVQITFGAGERQVRLLRGEAFFDVVPDPARPFRVDAAGVRVSVLGTAFSVRLAEDCTGVAVRHGVVRIAGPGTEATELHAGEWLRTGARTQRGTIPPSLVAGWMQGLLVARDRRVADVVDDIRRHQSGIIILRGQELAGQRVAGVYDLRRPQEALRAVAQAHGAEIRQVTPWVTVISRAE